MTKEPRTKEPAKSGNTLSIDVGGSGIKAIVLDPKGEPINKRKRIVTPRPATPTAVLDVIHELGKDQPPFDRIAVGFPGVVVEGVAMNAPNLDGDWSHVALAKEAERLLGRPCRAANDADTQGLAVVEGKGVELVLTLGTGMGSGLFLNGGLVPNLELGHHPLRKGMTYEEYVGKPALKAIGAEKWNRRVRRVVEQLDPIFNYRMLYLGGGHSRKLTGKWPKNVKIVSNVAGLLGGIKLWQ